MDSSSHFIMGQCRSENYYFLYQQFLLNCLFTGSKKLTNYSQISCGVIKNQESVTKDYPDRGKEVDWESQMFILIFLLIMLGFLCCGPIQARVSQEWVEETILTNQDKSFSLTALWHYPKTNLKIVNPLIKFSCEVLVTQKRLPFNGASLPSCPIWSNPY